MENITALDVYNLLKNYLGTQTELLGLLFAGEFHYEGSKKQPIIVELNGELKKDRIFDKNTGNFKGKLGRGIVSSPNVLLNNLISVTSRIESARIAELERELKRNIKHFNLDKCVPCAGSQNEACAFMTFTLIMYAIGGPLKYLIRNNDEKLDGNDQTAPDKNNEHEVYILHDNCPSSDLIAAKIDGYADEILEIRTQLLKRNNKVALVGMSGVGKSQLAIAVAESDPEMFATRLWVDFSNSILETITNDNTFSIWGCNRENYPQDTDRQYFQRKMRILKAIADRRVLIIIDGFNISQDPNLEEFLSGQYAVVITTQYRPAAGNLPTFEISHFKDEAKQLALFKEKYGINIDETEVEDILTMIRSWQGHTYGICLLATTMRQSRKSPREMRAQLSSGPAGTTDNSLAAKIRSDMHRLVHLNKLNPDEQYIMQNLALIPESGISVKEFYKWLECADFNVIESLIARSLVVNDRNEDTVHLHSMIVDIMLPALSESSCCTVLVNNLVSACQKAFDCTYRRKLELLGYIQSVYDRTVNMPDIRLTAGMQLGNILEMLGKYNESANIFKQLREMTSSGSLRVVIDSKIAHGLLLAGNLKEGHRVAFEGHKAFQKLQKEQIDKQAQRADNWLLQRLCEYYRWIGYYDMAEAYGNDSVSLLQNESKEDAWDIGWSKYHLAYALLVQGKLEECKQHLNEAISLFNEISSEYSSAFAMELLGQALMLEGEYTEALDLTVSAGSILHKSLDPNHADCGRNWMCQGNILRRAGKNEEALKCYTEAINVFRTSHETKANLVEALLDNNEIILDLWGKAFQLDNIMPL